MIPLSITRYLDSRNVQYERRPHRRAVTAQEVAAALDVTGRRVCKTVVVEADGAKWLALLPATEQLDTARFAVAVGARKVRMLPEQVFAPLFPDCEVGAEPPFASLYGMKLLVDASLPPQETLCVRAGSHEECLELSFKELQRLEKPHVASIGDTGAYQEARQQRELR